jgi:hypothetical protein
MIYSKNPTRDLHSCELHSLNIPKIKLAGDSWKNRRNSTFFLTEEQSRAARGYPRAGLGCRWKVFNGPGRRGLKFFFKFTDADGPGSKCLEFYGPGRYLPRIQYSISPPAFGLGRCVARMLSAINIKYFVVSLYRDTYWGIEISNRFLLLGLRGWFCFFLSVRKPSSPQNPRLLFLEWGDWRREEKLYAMPCTDSIFSFVPYVM